MLFKKRPKIQKTFNLIYGTAHVPMTDPYAPMHAEALAAVITLALM